MQIAPVVATVPKPGDSLSLDQDYDIASRHACFIAEYTNYVAAAGYSTGQYMLKERTGAARNFLRRFPDPEQWLELPLEQQLRCPSLHRTFLNYLFLRHLLPMPPQYILAGHHKLGDMAIRLMERETYQRYQAMGKRLGYSESDIRRQFQCLLYLMAWAQKPMDALTSGDLAGFTDVPRENVYRLIPAYPLLHL